MEQSSLKLQYKVGIFIAIGLIAIMVTVLLLGADKTFFTKYVHLKAQFTEVSGLFPGSVVSLAGMPVGNVEKIIFVDAQNKLEVDMKIDSQFAARLVEGTVAEVKTQGALGDKYLYLSPGLPTAKQLADGTMVQVSEQDFMKMLTSREDGAARVIDLIKELHVMVTNLNQGGMVHNMTEASAKMKSTLTELDGLLKDIRSEMPQNNKLKQSVASLASILDKIDQGKGSLGQLINDPSVHQSLKAFLGGSPRNTYMKSMIRETLQQSGPTK